MTSTCETEIEAKLLAGDATTLDAIAAREQIGCYRTGPLATHVMQTTYVDTEDMKLTRNGVALRFRCSNGSWEATAKWDKVIRDDAHERSEINVALPVPPRAPYRAPREIRERHPLLAENLNLRELLATDITRRVRNIVDDDLVIAELAIDTVQHSAPGSDHRCRPYYEIEIELRDGPRAALAEITAVLERDHDLSRTSGSKLSRALRDLYGLTRSSRSEP